MIDSYFFIPGDKPNYLSKIDEVGADYIIIDVEDSVAIKNKQLALKLVKQLQFNQNMFVRIPFFDDCYITEEIREFIVKFEGQIVLPKITKLENINDVISISDGIKLKMIILIENPTGFLATPEILKTFSNQIHAIGFGSHDFCSIAGIKHTTEYLAHYKQQLLLYAKAFNVAYIDGVDLNLNDFTQFKKECIFAFEMGANGKFLIHPKQVKELKNCTYMSDVELDRLSVVYNIIKDIPNNAIEVYTINGSVYEKPHIMRIKYLMNKLNRDNFN